MSTVNAFHVGKISVHSSGPTGHIVPTCASHCVLRCPITSGSFECCAIRLVLHGDFRNQRIVWRETKSVDQATEEARKRIMRTKMRKTIGIPGLGSVRSEEIESKTREIVRAGLH